MAEVKEIVSKEEADNEVMNDVQMLYSDSAIVRVSIEGSVLLRHVERADPYDEFPNGVRIEFFDQHGRTQSLLTAKYAVRYEKKEEVIARDSIVWFDKEGKMLESEELIWDQKEEIVYSNKFVAITQPEEVVYGYGFEAKQDFSWWTIRSTGGRIVVDGLKD